MITHVFIFMQHQKLSSLGVEEFEIDYCKIVLHYIALADLLAYCNYVGNIDENHNLGLSL